MQACHRMGEPIKAFDEGKIVSDCIDSSIEQALKLLFTSRRDRQSRASGTLLYLYIQIADAMQVLKPGPFQKFVYHQTSNARLLNPC